MTLLGVHRIAIFREPWRPFLFPSLSVWKSATESGTPGVRRVYAQDGGEIAESRIAKSKQAQKHGIPPTPEVQDRIRQENSINPPSAAYSSDTHDAARDLWISGWNDERIAKPLGIPRRETITEWARRGNWLAIQHDFRKRTLDRTLDITARKIAEANATQLIQIDALKKKVFTELGKNVQVQGKSVEGLVRATIALLAFERQVMGLDTESSLGPVEQRNDFAHEFDKMLARVKAQPDKTKELVRLNEERLLLEAKMREIAANEEPHADTDIRTS